MSGIFRKLCLQLRPRNIYNQAVEVICAEQHYNITPVFAVFNDERQLSYAEICDYFIRTRIYLITDFNWVILTNIETFSFKN